MDPTFPTSEDLSNMDSAVGAILTNGATNIINRQQQTSSDSGSNKATSAQLDQLLQSLGRSASEAVPKAAIASSSDSDVTTLPGRD